MAQDRSTGRIANDAPEADPLVRTALELAQYARDIGGIFLKGVRAGLLGSGNSGTV